MVIFAGADKGEDLLGVRDGDCPHAGLLLNDAGYFVARFRGKALTHDPHCAVGDVECLGGEDPGKLLIHSLLVTDHADKERRTTGVGQNHRGGDGTYQQQRFVERGGYQQDDHHLHDLGVESGKEGDAGLKQGICSPRAHQPPVNNTPEQPLAGGGDGAGEIGEAAQGITVQAAGQPYQKAHQWSPPIIPPKTAPTARVLAMASSISRPT